MTSVIANIIFTGSVDFVKTMHSFIPKSTDEPVNLDCFKFNYDHSEIGPEWWEKFNDEKIDYSTMFTMFKVTRYSEDPIKPHLYIQFLYPGDMFHINVWAMKASKRYNEDTNLEAHIESVSLITPRKGEIRKPPSQYRLKISNGIIYDCFWETVPYYNQKKN